MDEFEEEATPPSIERLKLRMMVLWANGCRSHLEGRYGTDPTDQARRIVELEEWVDRSMTGELTRREKERHRLAPGTWTAKQRRDDSWDTEAAVALGWAVGLRKRFPRWDKQSTNAGYTCLDAPSPESWHPELTLRPKAELDHQAMSVEARYWRILSRDPGERADAYRKKLMYRASKLRQVKLAADGDLALSDGTSVAQLSEAELPNLCSIQSERLEALNWLCGWEEDWDMVTADTSVNWLWDEHWPESGERE